MSEESEIIALYSPSELEEGSELDVLFKGEMLRYEVHQYFVINVRCVVLVDDLQVDYSSPGFVYFIARRINCVSPMLCIDIAHKSVCK